MNGGQLLTKCEANEMCSFCSMCWMVKHRSGNSHNSAREWQLLAELEAIEVRPPTADVCSDEICALWLDGRKTCSSQSLREYVSLLL